MIFRAACAMALLVAARRRGGPGTLAFTVAAVLLLLSSAAVALLAIVEAHSPGVTTQVDIEMFSELGITTVDALSGLLAFSGVASATRALRARTAS